MQGGGRIQRVFYCRTADETEESDLEKRQRSAVSLPASLLSVPRDCMLKLGDGIKQRAEQDT